MCGIAGIFTADRIDQGLLVRMAGAIAHRGPDDQNVWSDESAGIGFAHRRLSILDLSPEGRQPMHSADGRFVICFNGEIYNHGEIKSELEQAELGPESGWRGHSDTEILLQAIVAWGVEAAIAKCVGMFAMAVWDRKERLLHLVRDRFGEKPLYYGWAGPDLVFGSELKALRRHPNFDRTIDRTALKAFAARTYIPAPRSIYRSIFKLPPGTILSLSAAALARPFSEPPEGETGPARLHRFWNYRDVVRQGLANPIESEAEALDLLEQALAEAIKGQSYADVPVGAFLSGGIDSSTIVALYQKYSKQPVRTYSVGFEEAGFNEAEHAKAVAKHLGTIHHEHYVTVAEARDVIPLLPTMFDEPFADSSQIPTFLISRFARAEVTVALTGDGGDEMFGGYNRHVMAPRLWRQLRRLPRPLRSMAAAPFTHISPAVWAGLARLVDGSSGPFIGARIQKGLRIAQSAATLDDIYLNFLDEWSQEENPVLGSGGSIPGFDLNLGEGVEDATRMMFCDAVSYLPDDILVKVDRASMAVSLETRVPFLDHRVVAVAARIPHSMKIRGAQGKHILRQLLYREAPRHLFDRPKAGFAIPVGEWIRGPLRPWAEELLEPKRMADDGWFNPAIVQHRWREHLAGRRDSTPALWAVLMFQSWLREQRSDVALAA